MKLAGIAATIVSTAFAIAVIIYVFRDDDSNPAVANRDETTVGTDAQQPARVMTPTPVASPSATPFPATWLDGVEGLERDARPVLISCYDVNRDGRLNLGDDVYTTIDIPLVPGEQCVDQALHADFYSGVPSDRAADNCDAAAAPVLIVAIASAGSDLLMPREGESMGMVRIINELEARLRDVGASTTLIISSPAIFGAEQPQTNMERWLTAQTGGRLAAQPCLRAVLIGHSHGGATVTSVTAALDGLFGDRMLGVLIDRTVALYDRHATEMPARTLLLNFYQLNEGWHGIAIDAPNVQNFDESLERAPIAPSDGGGAPAIVSHKTLDDAPAVQGRIVEGVLAWLRQQ